jgi:hypothetical protein
MAVGRLWTEEENRVILEKLRELGPHRLMAHLPGRSAIAIQAHAQGLRAQGREFAHFIADPTPAWATGTIADRLENKAACVIALYLRRKRLANIDRQALADALGVHRATLERYMASVDRIPDYLDAIDQLLDEIVRR